MSCSQWPNLILHQAERLTAYSFSIPNRLTTNSPRRAQANHLAALPSLQLVRLDEYRPADSCHAASPADFAALRQRLVKAAAANGTTSLVLVDQEDEQLMESDTCPFRVCVGFRFEPCGLLGSQLGAVPW